MGEARLLAAREQWDEVRARAWDEAMDAYRASIADAWDEYHWAMVDCIRNGWSKADVARCLGVTPQRVGQLVEESMDTLLERTGR